MVSITKEQIKRVYALGAGAGLLERGSKEDNLHALVYSVTGRESISELTSAEFLQIERELLRLMRMSHRRVPLKTSGRKKVSGPAPGMMTAAQQALAWRLIYRLAELDRRDAAPGERLRGAIRKILGMEVSLAAPMGWIDTQSGEKLIEQLKRYVRSAEAKARKAREVG